MLHWHSPREDLIGVIALIVYVITCGSLSGGRNGSILDSHTIYFLSFGAFNLQESPLRIRGKSILWGLRRESPPRMRGKERRAENRKRRGGITPAHAGKRPERPRKCPRWWNHPRACGEKQSQVPVMGAPSGSPPRMRGKAAPCGHLPSLPGDHPRACGEKSSRPFWAVKS